MTSTTHIAPPSSRDSSSSASTTNDVQPLSNTHILFPEIWLLVFPYLKAPDLRSVSLTSAAFRYMAQPYLFTVLDVSPFLLSYNAERPTFRPRSYFKRFQERLQYFKLPHIAHSVRACWISPYTRSGFPPRNQQDDLEPDLIIDAVLEVLPLFPNLTSLSWHCIDITPKWWSIIQTLRLQKLWLNSSTVPLSVTSPLPYIVHLDLDQWPWEGRVTNHVSIHEERSPGVGKIALQHVIQPEVLRSISVPRADTARHLFSVISQSTYSLRSLKVPFSSISSPDFILALEHCPSLEALCIFPPSSDERTRDIKLDNLATSSLPSLKIYEGPYSHIMQFSRQSLDNVVLWGFDDPPAVCNPRALVETLAELAETSTRDSLRRLKITVIDITPDLLNVFSLFGCLESITVQSQDSTPRDMSLQQSLRSSSTVTALYAMMGKIVFPPHVRYVKLLTRLASPKLDINRQEHKAACFMESFARRNPALQRFEIGYGIYWTGMYSAIWGRLRENTETESAAVDEITSDNVDNGYSSESSSRNYILSTVVSSVHPLPLGKLTFTEHRRTILFPNDTSGMLAVDHVISEFGEKRFFSFLWMRVRRLFNKPGLTRGG